MRDHFAAHPLIHLHIFSAMRPMRLMRLLVLPVFAITLANCTNPRAEANMAQALNDAANEIGGLKNDIAQIQTDLDSLRSVVAKQDSVINRIAAANNIPRWETVLALALKLTSPIGRGSVELATSHSAPPTMKVTIEYCVMWNYEPRAVSLAAEIRERFPDAEVELTPSRGGRFEVTADGHPIFEKSKLKRHAGPGEIVTLLATR